MWVLMSVRGKPQIAITTSESQRVWVCGCVGGCGCGCGCGWVVGWTSEGMHAWGYQACMGSTKHARGRVWIYPEILTIQRAQKCPRFVQNDVEVIVQGAQNRSWNRGRKRRMVSL